MKSQKSSKQSVAGNARAKKLSSERRSEIAQKAAVARWSKDVPTAAYEGTFTLGDTEITCAVLPNGQRLIAQAAFLRSLGRSPTPTTGTGVFSTFEKGLPVFLGSEVFQEFINDDLKIATTPIFYASKTRGTALGYDARLLPQVAEVYLKYRDKIIIENGKVPKVYEKMIKAADILMRGLANVGIVALVDEATGYQRDRATDALAKILEAYIAKELRPYIPTFPVEFYEELFRLKGMAFPRDNVRRPQYFGKLTNNIIYQRLAPGVLEELKRVTPKSEQTGRPKHQFHRLLTSNHGYIKLKELLSSVITIMKLSESYEKFLPTLDRIHPKFNHPLPLPFDSIESETSESDDSKM